MSCCSSGGPAIAEQTALGRSLGRRFTHHLNFWMDPSDQNEGVVSEACSILVAYGITGVYSDKFSAGWSKQAFARHGITLLDAPDKSTVYAELEPLITSGRVRLLDHPRQNRELGQLERRPRAGGKPLIGPPRGARDDFANALALAMVAAAANADLPPLDTRPTQDELRQLQDFFPMLELREFRDY